VSTSSVKYEQLQQHPPLNCPTYVQILATPVVAASDYDVLIATDYKLTGAWRFVTHDTVTLLWVCDKATHFAKRIASALIQH